jgi:hypothetical protein
MGGRKRHRVPKDRAVLPDVNGNLQCLGIAWLMTPNLGAWGASSKIYQTLNRKCATSPSAMTYALPSARMRPASRMAFSFLCFSRSATE